MGCYKPNFIRKLSLFLAAYAEKPGRKIEESSFSEIPSWRRARKVLSGTIIFRSSALAAIPGALPTSSEPRSCSTCAEFKSLA